MDSVSPQNRRKKKPSNLLLGDNAIDIARSALEELGDGEVGAHVGIQSVSKYSVTHRFEAQVPGYPGWEWNAVLACAHGSEFITVNEVALVPAPNGDALCAPEWIPWSKRVLPGDLEPGMLMPPDPHDPRLTEPATDSASSRVLSNKGLEDTKKRWREGQFGPTSEFAVRAALSCETCAFFIAFDRPLGPTFGACLNEYAADGHVVHSKYGCGAHSDTKLPESEHHTGLEAFDDEQTLED